MYINFTQLKEKYFTVQILNIAIQRQGYGGFKIHMFISGGCIENLIIN